MRIVVPMAGAGKRFAEAGYKLPKPLIDVNGKPMIERVVENLKLLGSEFVFLVRREHLDKYDVESVLDRATDGHYTIVPVEKLTEGAACTVLLAKKHIDNIEPIVIANSDQLVEYNLENFELFNRFFPDWIFTFHATDSKWSFVRTDKYGRVVEVAEKRQISNIATVGWYGWAEGRRFVRAAEEMIAANDRVNGEFYVCPTYNYSMKEMKNVYPFFVDKMMGLGTPEELHDYLHRTSR